MADDNLFSLYKPGHSSGSESWKDPPNAKYNCMVTPPLLLVLHHRCHDFLGTETSESGDVGAGGCKRLFEFAGPAFGDWSKKGGMEYGDWHHVTPVFAHHRKSMLPDPHPLDKSFAKASFS
eukprot:1774939-Rhodomonas_salina.1